MPGMPGMSMPGKSMGGHHAASASAHVSHHAAASHGAMSQMAMGSGAAMHSSLNLLPDWLGYIGVAVFLLIAASHLRHLVRATGERKPWHATHVLMAIGMAFMYAPTAIDPFGIPALFWRLLFGAGAALAAVRLVIEWDAKAPSPLWLVTAIDLVAMVYMWSASAFTPALTWTLVAYFSLQAVLWAADAYRRIDSGIPLVGWGVMSNSCYEGVGAIAGVRSESLLGGLDIGVSLAAMAVGMAYMLAAMQVVL